VLAYLEKQQRTRKNKEDTMKKYTGTVKSNPLEGGVWMLDASDGFMYQLIFAMTGPISKVTKLTKK
jgi:hypothetical protein